MIFSTSCLGTGDGIMLGSGDLICLMGCRILENLEKPGDFDDTSSSLAAGGCLGCGSAGFFVDTPVDLVGELSVSRETLARRGGAACRNEDLGEPL